MDTGDKTNLCHDSVKVLTITGTQTGFSLLASFWIVQTMILHITFVVSAIKISYLYTIKVILY